jgi:type VI secretion system protein ImpB
MAKRSQQKTSSRVNIVYDVPVGDAIERVSLPFVMGVMADLSGKPGPDAALKPVGEREFVEFTHDNFDERMKAIQPRVAFQVPNALRGGSGQMNVTATFDSMEDFSPANVVRKIDGLRDLLETRERLENLLTHLDGNNKAEELLGKLLADPAKLQALASAPKAPSAAAPAQE